MRYFLFLLSLLFMASSSPNNALAQQNRTLTIYSSKAFARDWMQIGNHIKRTFEFNCNCNIELVTLSDTNAAFSRLILEGKASKADMIIGIDESMAARARSLGLFTIINASTEHLTLPFKWSDQYFLPYSYAYTAFVYNSRKLKNPPKSFDELLARDDIKIIIQDPRSSPTGMAFLIWLNLIYQDQTMLAWKKLKTHIIAISKSWHESYGLFIYGEADMVMSYNTSPAYHAMTEDNYDIKSVEFSDGHYLHFNLMGKLKNAPNPDLADQFANFLLSKPCQRLIPINNFSMPVINIGEELPNEYSHILMPAKILTIKTEELIKNRQIWIEEWLKTLSEG